MSDRDHDDDGPPSPERLTRNWSELLQELRVVQTGVQILTGFLLTVPFSSRFTELDGFQVTTYLVVMAGAVLTTAFVVAPVAFHRVLFRHHRRWWLVEAANRAARTGLALLALTSSGVLLLVFDVTVGPVAGFLALGVSLGCFTLLWVVLPLASAGGRTDGGRTDGAGAETARRDGPPDAAARPDAVGPRN